MTRLATSLIALIASIALLVSGNAFLMTLLGLRLSVEGFSTSLIGWILVCYSVGFTLGCHYGPRSPSTAVCSASPRDGLPVAPLLANILRARQAPQLM